MQFKTSLLDQYQRFAMYLSNLLLPQIPLKDIAKYYKRKDHTTVLHAKKKIENDFKEDKNLRVKIEKLIQNIKE